MVRKLDRKEFIQIAGLAAMGSLAMPQPELSRNTPTIKALAFDAFAIFNPGPVLKTVQELFPEQAKQLIEIWQSRQFTYQWLRVLGNKYKNFWDVTSDALDFAFLQCGLDPQHPKKNMIMDAYQGLQTWPDVVPVIQKIKEEKLMVGFLSNMTTKMLNQGIQNSNLNEYFDFVISTDEQQTFKPSPKAYQMATEKLKLTREQILFVAFAGWDAAGAKWFGYPTFWLNRSNSNREELQSEPDGKGATMSELLEFVRSYKR